MFNPNKLGLALSFAIIASGATLLMSQQRPAESRSSSVAVELTGKEMFKAYCASCHGEDARGQGPATQALKITPPDLTLLARQNKGKFPADHVNAVIVHGINTPAHGSAEMPVWGPVFVELKGHRAVIVRANRLSEFIETLQAK